MNKIINIVLSVVILALLSACSKEREFPGSSGYGKVNTRSLTVEMANEENTRAASVDVADFTVRFFLDGETTAVASYRYGDMREVVVLPVGRYTAKASYGTNPSAAWDAPYYEGQTLSSFEVMPDQVTMVSDPIVCKLANIKVTVSFTDELAAQMSAGSKVSVKVGEYGSSLEYTVADRDKAGYFAYVDNSQTLAATFIGEVQGFPTTETKVYDDVQPGNHYRIIFDLSTPDEEPGDITGLLRVDASVEIEDLNRPVDSEDEILKDDMRPKEDNGDTPDPPATQGPSVSVEAPVSFEAENDVTPSSKVVVKVKSSAPGGIKRFDVEIISDSLSEDALNEVGLSTHLDLVNPGEYLTSLQGLGLLGEGVESLGGQTDVTFDISGFMVPLSAFGSQTHKFKFTISDESGSTEKILILRMNV